MPEQSHFRWVGGDLHIQLRVTPRASRDQIGPLLGDRLKISVAAPPVDGKANRHLVKLVAKRFTVPQSAVDVVRGVASRDKTVSISQPQRLPQEFEVTERG
jgi:uncharacterized protein (TIGR00251 family)